MKYCKTEKTIETNRLLLRLFKETDATEVAELCDNYNLYKNTLYLPYPYSIEDALSWMKNHLDNFNDDKSYEFAITDKVTGKLFGAVALTRNQGFNNGEIAYWVGEKHWGNGYATEAAKAILEFAFVEKQYHKVFARYFQSNLASGKVIEKIGMKKEGILREHVIKENDYIDLVYCGILKTEFNVYN
ncbi:GNAT family N-acetyltransferase [Halalkalibacter sp. APA_J-10(15)]|uniref:GNAT family N-acetyltransferase n=1 Tax=Halalkalibacter sp. APA_J-10(15) TaxID=2933805 RepID=UPI001FF51ED0|nr:GNAT family N-acetyltransferase [Halalkalibacter sp. APA_J-10(15)]MCK0473239.1 GNAT family N-acetyltransferase [Halalkalibacter sp. APA_J-10(15)]